MRIVLATNFQILDEEKSAFWNDFAVKLGERGMFLLVLTTNVHNSLKAPYLEIPYTLAGFGQFAFDVPAADGFLRAQMDLEASWQVPENLEGVEHGALQCAAFFSSLLDMVEPDLVLSWNALQPQSRILQLACAERCVPCQTIEQGLLPGTLFMDPGGNHLDASLDNSFAIVSMLAKPTPASQSVKKYREWFNGRRPAKYRNPDCTTFNLLKAKSETVSNTVLILASALGTGLAPPEQMMSRRTLPGVGGVPQILEDIAAAAEGSLLVFRDHPINRGIGMTVQLPVNIHSGQDASLYDYMGIADYVIVIGGTTAAYECLVMQKPVLVVGRNMLKRLAPCAYSDGSDLRTKLREFLQTDWSAYAVRADHVLSFLLDHYLIMQIEGLEGGNKLDDLVTFIDEYDSGNRLRDEEGSQRIVDWILNLPREGL